METTTEIGTDIEKLLLEINKHKEKFHFSCDIYYDDLGEDFVVKVHHFGYSLNEEMHFRNKKLVNSLIDALDFVKNHQPT